MPDALLYIGLDAGGTKTAVLTATIPPATPLALTGPAANLQRQGVDDTAGVLAALIREALAQHPGATLAACCAGVAGAAHPADQHRLAEGLRRVLEDQPPFHVQITHDGAIALEGAFEGESGLIVIAGTGSSLFARTRQGEIVQAGGWGYLLGDEGSGHALGLLGLRAVAQALDGGPPTRLRTLLADRHGLDTPEALKRSVYREGWPIQQMAPLVLEAAEAGDARASAIVAAQTEALAGQATRLTARHADIAPRLALLGGLTRSAYYKQRLTDALRTALPGWQATEPLHPPVVGALRLAQATRP